MTIVLRVTAVVAAAVLGSASALADETVGAPPWSIAGENWICIQQCATGHVGATVKVVQNGARFVFIDDLGRREDAQWMGEGQISFVGCDNNATLSVDHNRLDFVFGSVWIR
jgi:hypothetical protein